eukprot:Protomagalhaensia_sp_Gyna_25__397@NODE_1189_length_2083_cov_13_279354_g945_i0_p2_GENE_NODE_1189_length_2083_cov_13_279354_g945_i0NODE_1189_length_2083_cov_13_279354_g945_i0_p2_ORF_typecomplete_len114_score1_42Prorich_19/PF15455_6/0_025_NODE_1189_length_2083_cov_13_279354_g945_i08991240
MDGSPSSARSFSRYSATNSRAYTYQSNTNSRSCPISMKQMVVSNSSILSCCCWFSSFNRGSRRPLAEDDRDLYSLEQRIFFQEYVVGTLTSCVIHTSPRLSMRKGIFERPLFS